MPGPIPRIRYSIAIGLALFLAADAARAIDSIVDRSALLARLESTDTDPLRSCRAYRRLSASTRHATVRGSLDVWTTMDAGRMAFTVVNAAGSSMIRNRVLMAALEGEKALLQAGEPANGAITSVNYDFLSISDNSSGLVRLDIRPRRKDTLLVHGSVLVESDTADIVLIEGLLAKRPSFWTRRVRIERRYARIGGVRVPTSMTSSADVLIVGQSSFAMTYCYEEVNGALVGTCAPEMQATP